MVLASGAPSRLIRIRQALTPREWGRLGATFGVVGLLHVLGWGTLLLLVVPQHLTIGHQTFGVVVGVTAYTLGMRHAFDADHIAAIDNTTRKLMTDGQRPLTVGFWFSLGHSSIVFAATLLLSFGVRALVGPLEDDGSALHRYTGIIGTSVSGVFLLAIAAVNVVVLAGVVRIWRGMRAGRFDEAELEDHLERRGFLNRILGRVMRSISRPAQMYPVGLLFGLGFDTATEVALLVLAGAGALTLLPWYSVLCLPVLFAAGMSLLDTIDGSFMNFAYGWAFSQPVRKVYYNMTITGLSVAVAVIVGGAELLALLGDQLGLTGGFWGALAGVDLNTVGFVVVGLFVVTWLVALLVWRFGRIEEKWSAGLRSEG